MEEKFVKEIYPAAAIGVNTNSKWVIYSHMNKSIRKIIGHGDNPKQAWKDAKNYVQNELNLLR